jgi:hypothetical protein
MPGDLAHHFASGHHTHGVILLRADFPLARYIDDIILIWSITEADEWIDRTEVIPF